GVDRLTGRAQTGVSRRCRAVRVPGLAGNCRLDGVAIHDGQQPFLGRPGLAEPQAYLYRTACRYGCVGAHSGKTLPCVDAEVAGTAASRRVSKRAVSVLGEER